MKGCNIFEQKKNIISSLSLLLIITILLLPTLLFQIVFAQVGYTLRVFTFGGTFEERQRGVAIVVFNMSTGGRIQRAQQFFGLPPPSTVFFFSSFEMPAGSALRACAFDLPTRVTINCVDGTAGLGTSEFITLSLNPRGMR